MKVIVFLATAVAAFFAAYWTLTHAMGWDWGTFRSLCAAIVVYNIISGIGEAIMKEVGE